jgi:hypothetical protein
MSTASRVDRHEPHHQQVAVQPALPYTAIRALFVKVTRNKSKQSPEIAKAKRLNLMVYSFWSEGTLSVLAFDSQSNPLIDQ